MKTTITLDDDIAVALERLSRERHASLDDVANEALRFGLPGIAGGATPGGGFTTRSVSLGRALMPVDSIADTLAAAEGEKAT